MSFQITTQSASGPFNRIWLQRIQCHFLLERRLKFCAYILYELLYVPGICLQVRQGHCIMIYMASTGCFPGQPTTTAESAHPKVAPYVQRANGTAAKAGNKSAIPTVMIHDSQSSLDSCGHEIIHCRCKASKVRYNKCLLNSLPFSELLQLLSSRYWGILVLGVLVRNVLLGLSPSPRLTYITLLSIRDCRTSTSFATSPDEVSFFSTGGWANLPATFQTN